MSRKVIITCALVGSATVKTQNPAVPYTPEELATAASDAMKAGAAMVHVHAREDDGKNSTRVERIREAHESIKAKCPDLIVNCTSALGAGATYEQRMEQIAVIRPEMASLNMATMNFAAVNRKTGEVIGDYTFENRLEKIVDFARLMKERGVKPELECYSMAGLENYFYLRNSGCFEDPVNFNFVWGVCGGASFRPGTFVDMVNTLPEKANFTACGVGNQEWSAIAQAILCGGHVRVGLEDNVRMPDGSLAKDNAALVGMAARIVESLGCEVATPSEARTVLGIKK
ncbi:MAG: 3-keto-5-aminohexanoate cleavage protein [Spirochaetales bacterium]|nr:MAG: 3-keto-5-aminohexanoate cleavage protein [Spirochaetales bacterium]